MRIIQAYQNNVYMNGAMAEPWARTMSTPNNAIMIKIGHNQNFFLARKNIHNSLIIVLAIL